MHRNVIETIMGGVVLVVAIVFLVFAYSSTTSGTISGYTITAKFNSVNGLAPGSDVRLSGIKVGSVLDTTLDPQDYTAIVSLSMKNSVKLPTDSSARVLADGLLGNNYLELQPGAEDTMIEPGGRIPVTQDPINIVDLLGRFVFGAVDKAKQDSQGGQGGGTSASP